MLHGQHNHTLSDAVSMFTLAAAAIFQTDMLRGAQQTTDTQGCCLHTKAQRGVFVCCCCCSSPHAHPALRPSEHHIQDGAVPEQQQTQRARQAAGSVLVSSSPAPCDMTCQPLPAHLHLMHHTRHVRAAAVLVMGW